MVILAGQRHQEESLSNDGDPKTCLHSVVGGVGVTTVLLQKAWLAAVSFSTSEIDGVMAAGITACCLHGTFL